MKQGPKMETCQTRVKTTHKKKELVFFDKQQTNQIRDGAYKQSKHEWF